MTNPTPKMIFGDRVRDEKIPHPSGDDGGNGLAWAIPELPVEVFTETRCVKCEREIKVMSFKGTGVCSEVCRKFRDGEIDEGRYRELTDVELHK